jgi:hypothetical protein
MTVQLTASQHAVLVHAIDHTDGKIEWFPDHIKGGARKKVLDGLLNRALITSRGTEWCVTADGYEALGMPHRGPITLAALDAVIANAEAAQTDVDPEIEAAVSAIEATARAEAKKPRTRDNSKQASVIAMLKRPEGATIAQIVDATGWQAHTVRGTFAGAFKKKLGLSITSHKAQGGERIYRIEFAKEMAV